MLSIALALTLALTTDSAEAGIRHRRTWEKIEVPGATCGDGSPYSVFFSPGLNEKIVVSFMGGGACWDFESCYGANRRTWLHGVVRPRDRLGGIYSADPSKNEAAHYGILHFPYCTGDVHLGRHHAVYNGMTVHHVGADNIEMGLQAVIQQGLIDPPSVTDLVVYGYSAGAIGALYHVLEMEKNFPAATRKTLIPDSPGLHFGKKFWKKFTPELVNDYSTALAAIGYTLDPDRGMMGEVIGGLCERLNLTNWRVGVLQGSHDIVMSAVFGEINPAEHARRIFGKGGLWEMGRRRDDNCTAWIPDTLLHTFLVSDLTAEVKSAGTDAWDFLRAQITHGDRRSYP